MKRAALAIFALALPGVTAADSPHPDKGVENYFENYCIRCHNAEKQKGKFRLDNLSRDFGDELVAQHWAEVLTRINSGEMPPEEEEKQPTPKETGIAAGWISARINEGLADRMSRRAPVAMYRLSRDEYANTVRDLLGVHFDVHAPGAFNEDPRWHGFDRIGSLLSLSPSHVERYFEAAGAIIAEAYPDRPPKPSTGRYQAEDERAQKWKAENHVTDPVRLLLLPGVSSGASLHARSPGIYKIKVQLSGLPSFKGRLPHLTIWDGTVKRSLHGQDILAPEDQPAVIEFETYLPEGRHSLMNEAPGTFEALTLALTKDSPFTNTRERRFTHPSSYKLYRDDGTPIFPMLIVDWMEWEGPLPSDVYLQSRARFQPASESPEDVRKALKTFLEKAWRHPPAKKEIDRFFNVFNSELAAGEKFASAYHASLVAALTAKNFYYLTEGSPGTDREILNDWELASRLSYFLWGSMPDEALFESARNGTLQQPQVLQAHARRMLKDPKTRSFLDAFPRQWLQLHKVGMFPPDGNLYPDYDNWLEESMALESTHFFQEVFKQNLPAKEFLTGNWTVLNARLAMHYGMPQIKSPGFQKVTLNPNDPRGGILTQASVLSLTSDGTRHRPVHRGVWIYESIFGKSPPPPPPNVEPLAPTPSDKPKATIRQQLEAHSTHNTCSSCHRKIDPLGFAFDNFNAIGQWREREIVPDGQGEDPPVNASGELPDGKPFSGPSEFKARLAEDQAQFAQALTSQLATFALRRLMTIDDQPYLQQISAATANDDYRLQDIVETLILSDLFQRR